RPSLEPKYWYSSALVMPLRAAIDSIEAPAKPCSANTISAASSMRSSRSARGMRRRAPAALATRAPATPGGRDPHRGRLRPVPAGAVGDGELLELVGR